jgi:hypothetical protein
MSLMYSVMLFVNSTVVLLMLGFARDVGFAFPVEIETIECRRGKQQGEIEDQTADEGHP